MHQHSEEWIKARLGKATASRASDWMAELKTGGTPAVRKNYLAELVLERLTGQPAPNYQSQAMLLGIELEPDARAAYAFATNVDVVECGFIPHPQIANAGASPDGFVGADGLVELKCPNDATHLDTLLRPDDIPKVYVDQMNFQMAVTGRQWCDLVSYNPNYPDRPRREAPNQSMRLVITRLPRNPLAIAKTEIAVVKFLVEVDVAFEALCQGYPMLSEVA